MKHWLAVLICSILAVTFAPAVLAQTPRPSTNIKRLPGPLFREKFASVAGVATKSGQSKTLGNSCQAHQTVIRRHSSHMISLASNIEKKFTAISTRVEEFYKNKVLAEGK